MIMSCRLKGMVSAITSSGKLCTLLCPETAVSSPRNTSDVIVEVSKG